jgi:TldD protein
MLLLALVALIAGATPLSDLLANELDRAMTELSDREEQPHYVALALTDESTVYLAASDAAIYTDNASRERTLDVDLRVGSPQLDSTHPLRGFSALEDEGRMRYTVPLDDGFALRHGLWRELDLRYREASERIVLVRANQAVKVEEEDPADDFEPRGAAVAHVPLAELPDNLDAWRASLLRASEIMAADPHIHAGSVSVSARRTETTFVDTEGTALTHGRLAARVGLSAETTADDGDVIGFYRAIDGHGPDRLPEPSVVVGWAEEAVQHLGALRQAPRGEPFSGPVLLEGRAAAVFFHEVFGHRVEGHRQKRDNEGKTFAEHVGRQILPPSINVVDDPTVRSLHGHDLNGYYTFDDEGTPAMPATLVKDGTFIGFLMNRSPISAEPNTNGHGRRSTGRPPAARMGNTIVTSTEMLTEAELRATLLEQIRDQSLEYGYLVQEIEGGFTLTGRVVPNAFNVRATTSKRVFADGRPDELVRGIDLVGTPLVAFESIVATGGDPQVFNGTCGAESGWVPVSGVAPSIVFRRLEFQLKEKGAERPPLRPKPLPDTDGTSEAR